MASLLGCARCPTSAMPPATAKLKSDLLISRQELAGGPSFVLKDPATSRFFRVKQAEYSILRRLDGSTPLEVIRRKVEDELGARLSLATCERFIETLRGHGLLETGPEGHLAGSHGGRLRGSILYLRFKAFDPDRLLDGLLRRVRYCFTPAFVWFSALSILGACALSVANSSEIGRGLPGLLRLDSLVWAWLAIVLIGAAHELAHGLTCKSFGGKVNDLGLLLIYFQPALYCDVSDAWLLPEKRKRLWVTFAGPFFELLLWAFATFVWRATEPETWINRAALIVWATSGIKVFFDLNPLIKLDGYYLLSDYLELPNLRARAFRYLGDLLRRRSGLGDAAVAALSPREKRICLGYGSLAGIFSVALLGTTLAGLGGFLVGAYQGTGFVLLASFLLFLGSGRLRQAARRVGASFGAGWLPDDPAARRRWIRFAWLGALAALAAALVVVPMELRVSGQFRVLPTYTAKVQTSIDGIVEDVFVEQGQKVQAGELIARLSNRELRAELEKIRAEIGEKRARFRILRAGPRPEEIEIARIRVENAKTTREHVQNRRDEVQRIRSAQLVQAKAAVRKSEARLRFAQRELDRLTTLFDAGVVSRRQLEGSQEELAVRRGELEEVRAAEAIVVADDLAMIRKESALADEWLREAEAGLELLLAGTREEELEAAEAEIARLEAQRVYLERQLELFDVTTPISGVVVTARPKERIGQYLRKGEVLGEVQDLETLRIEIAVSEKDIADVKVDQRISLKARARSRRSFEARVLSIAPSANGDALLGESKTVLVNTKVEDAFPSLRPEMTGMAKIHCGPHRIFDILTRRLYRYIRVEFWSWW